MKMIIYRARDESDVEQYLQDDPYLVEGVGGQLSLREWSPIVGLSSSAKV
jgi:uncharacterized protein YciI